VEGVANFSWFFLSSNLFPMSRLVLDRTGWSGVAIPGISCSIVSFVPPHFLNKRVSRSLKTNLC